ncbi:hypothetical protein D3C85_1611230 [compost metagenome]
MVCLFQYVVSTLLILYDFIAGILSLDNDFPVVLKCFFEEFIGGVEGNRVIYNT